MVGILCSDSPEVCLPGISEESTPAPTRVASVTPARLGINQTRLWCCSRGAALGRGPDRPTTVRSGPHHQPSEPPVTLGRRALAAGLVLGVEGGPAALRLRGPRCDGNSEVSDPLIFANHLAHLDGMADTGRSS